MQSLFASDRPEIPVRGLHLDLKGVPPTPQRLISLLKVAAAGRYNALLVEWEDMFPWTVDTRFRCETAYTPQQVRDFAKAASDLGMEIIPLVQCLGHMETPLSVPGYEHMREVPCNAGVLNPLAAGARQLVESMIDDVLALLPGLRHFHLGGDEAWSFGTHPDTKAFVEKHGKGELYLHHVGPLLDKLNAQGIRPILWSDMMHDWPTPALTQIAAKADLCPWGYSGHPDKFTYHSNSKYIARFKEHGVTLWGAAAYKGGDGHNIDLPKIPIRQENALGWVEVAKRYGLVGVFTTAWSRYSTHRTQVEPIDACLDIMLWQGVALHDGAAPSGGMEACVEALGAIGEGQRFTQCHDAMAKLADVRRAGWSLVQRLGEQIAMETADARRRESAGGASWIKDFRQTMNVKAAEAEQATRQALAGLLDPIWIERYLGERLAPLRELLGMYEARIAYLEPAAYQALPPKP